MSFRHSAHGLDTPRGEDWRASAACRDEDPELFFPIGEAGHAQEQEAVAKWICAGCPVQRDCLEFALEFLPFGVAGGMNEEERKRLRPGQKPASVTARVSLPRQICANNLHAMTGDNVKIIRRDGGKRIIRACLTCYLATRHRIDDKRAVAA